MSIRTAFVSTYPPRRCGIASFTRDLASVVGAHEVVALQSTDRVERYPPEVHHRIRRDVDADYARAARALRDCDVDVVSIQHEYGIWGGEDGASVLDFVRALDKPVVATLHTVLRHPTPSQRRILSQLVRGATTTVVMSGSAASLLTTVYDVGSSQLEIVPHGVPDLDLVDSSAAKPSLGLAGRRVLLSFGLLGPSKGFELAIEALPAIVRDVPDVCYVVLGATHPDLLRRDGESYRRSLVERTAALGMADHVRFVDRFVSPGELGRWLGAADVVVTPYPNLDQIVSGTLSYAMGAGRAVVSTPYAYAAELLADGRGVLVQPGSPGALADAVANLLRDPALRATVGRRAYEYSRPMVWQAVGAAYARVFARVARAAPGPAIASVPMPPIRV
ncbi:MAG TPA: glycosyltransferase family 4 protein [Candidatus Lustribacter sp.]|nr:glycosyltransferase family 4 protein [Candidatus Lustribacter sp.]